MNEEPCPSYREADMREVDVTDRYAVRWWCQRFVCTESMLRGAVAAVGGRWRDVHVYLRTRVRAMPPRSRRAARDDGCR
ncbi:MAG TPA: DUF3606 domain-containing protein [Casimicrobiaceae bacterium]|jgi:hypothetical protein